VILLKLSIHIIRQNFPVWVSQAVLALKTKVCIFNINGHFNEQSI